MQLTQLACLYYCICCASPALSYSAAWCAGQLGGRNTRRLPLCSRCSPRSGVHVVSCLHWWAWRSFRVCVARLHKTMYPRRLRGMSRVNARPAQALLLAVGFLPLCWATTVAPVGLGITLSNSSLLGTASAVSPAVMGVNLGACEARKALLRAVLLDADRSLLLCAHACSGHAYPSDPSWTLFFARVGWNGARSFGLNGRAFCPCVPSRRDAPRLQSATPPPFRPLSAIRTGRT